MKRSDPAQTIEPDSNMKKISNSNPSRGGGNGGITTAVDDTTKKEEQKNSHHEIPNLNNKAQYAYEVRGDASSALEILENVPLDYTTTAFEDTTFAFDLDHNLSLFKFLIGPDGNSVNSMDNQDGNQKDESSHMYFENKLKELYSNSTNYIDVNDKSSKIIIMQKFVLGHNLALKYLITNRPEEGVSVLLPLFRSFFANENEYNKHDDDDEAIEFDDMKCKIAFLLLDCIVDSCQLETIDEILKWIQDFILEAVEKKRDESFCSSLKFRLHCYKSRALFLKSKYEQTTICEKNIRMAKKELKSAMEIYHHKLVKQDETNLRVKGVGGGGCGESTVADEGASVQESVAPSIGSLSNDPLQDATNANSGHSILAANENGIESQSQFHSKILHRQNKCALYLKANLEHVKQNTKKSLKLCTEAQHCGVRQRDSSPKKRNEVVDQWSSDIQSAYHFNNLAIIHQVAGKLHLATYYYSRSLSHIENIETQGYTSVVEEDGIASPIPISQILFNASVCAQQLANYSVAHECMKRCVTASPILFGNDPFCWLHMGESCVNSHVSLKRKSRRVDKER